MLLSTRLGFRLDSLHPDSRYWILLKNNKDKQDSFVTRIVLPNFSRRGQGSLRTLLPHGTPVGGAALELLATGRFTLPLFVNVAVARTIGY